jgi:Mechanosensitive ion channel, conserved TM helix
MQELFDVQAWHQVLVRALSELGATLGAFLPSLVGALLILGIGWLLSRALELAAGRLLRSLGVDRASLRLGMNDVLERTGLDMTLSALIARLLFWLLLLTFLISSVETLGLEAVTGTIDRLVAFIPNLIGAGLIVLLGLLLGRFLGGVAASAAAAAGFRAASRVGFVVQALVAALVLVIAIEQLGVETHVLVAPLTALVAAAGFSAGLAFALGARPVVTHILAGHFLRQSLPREVFVEVAGRRGVVQRVGATDTLLRDGDQHWSIPNAQLLETIVVR